MLGIIKVLLCSQIVSYSVIVKRLRCSPDSVLQSAFKREPHVDHCKPIVPIRQRNALTLDQ